MNEFIEKLIGRLEEQKSDLTTWSEDKAFEIGIETAISIVNQLAEEYNNGWISANDRLPEENGKYIVYYRKWTFGNYLPKFDEKEIRILRYSTNGWFFPTYGDVEAEKDIHREVIAWQPLPEPYTQKGDINGTE